LRSAASERVSAAPWRIVWSQDGQSFNTLAHGSDASGNPVQIAQLLSVPELKSLGQQQDASPLAFLDVSSDGHLVAQTNDAQTLALTDIASGKQLRTITPGYQVTQAAFSADGKQLATASGDQIQVDLWDVASGQKTASFTGFQTAAPVYSVQWGPDGKTLLWISRELVQPMDVASGKFGPELRHEDFVGAVALAPKGGTLAVATAATIQGQLVPAVKLWDPASGQAKGVIQLSQSASQAGLAFSPEDNVLAVAVGKSVQFYDLSTQKQVSSLNDLPDQVVALAFSPDGAYLLVATGDGTLTLWALPG
jgi:WD40 repeat protein